MLKRAYLFGIVFLFACLTVGAYKISAAEDPAACIEEIGIAVDAADPDTFQELVDVDEVLNKALNAFIVEASKPENAVKLPPLAAMLVQQLGSTGVTGDGLRKLVVDQMRSFVLHGIASGAFAGKSVQGVQSGGLLAPLLTNASYGRKQITSIGRPKEDANDWLVPFTVYDHGNGQYYFVTGRLAQAENGLKLVEIDNIAELIGKIANESMQQDLTQ